MEPERHISFNTPIEATYNPDDLDILEFEAIYQDSGLFKAMCRLAHDMGTNVSALWNTIQAHVLTECNYWDPASPKEPPCRVSVKVRDLQNNPKALDMGPNKILQGHMLAKKEAQDLDEIIDILDDEDI